MALELKIPAFGQGEPIPQKHTCEGADVSPALSWGGESAGTKSFALIVDDPDAPAGTWNHWLLCDIPASVHSLEEGFKAGQIGVSGRSDFGRAGYGGPCPPVGHGPHRYFFRLYALDVESLGASDKVKRAELDAALKGHILAEAQYMGTYERKR